MTLVEIRAWFIRLSGRYDLQAAGEDNGTDFFINQAIRFLEKKVEVPEATARLYYPLAAGEYSVTFQHNCRVIREVWVNDAEDRFELEKVPLRELRDFYADQVIELDSGQPTYYSLAELRALETTARDSLATFLDKTWDEADTNYDFRGIVLAPPSDGNYVVEVKGLFGQAELTANADENYWTVREPLLVIRAALYMLESTMRGASNADQWLKATMDGIAELDKDTITEQIVDIDQMEG